MSLITFANLVMANSEKEKCKARIEHYEAVKNEPSDIENINAFLSDCTPINKTHVNPLNSHFIEVKP